MPCEEALSHSWMAMFESADPGTAKNLSKDKMKKFLARQKWKVLRRQKEMLSFKKSFFFLSKDSLFS